MFYWFKQIHTQWSIWPKAGLSLKIDYRLNLTSDQTEHLVQYVLELLYFNICFVTALESIKIAALHLLQHNLKWIRRLLVCILKSSQMLHIRIDWLEHTQRFVILHLLVILKHNVLLECQPPLHLLQGLHVDPWSSPLLKTRFFKAG